MQDNNRRTIKSATRSCDRRVVCGAELTYDFNSLTFDLEGQVHILFPNPHN